MTHDRRRLARRVRLGLFGAAGAAALALAFSAGSLAAASPAPAPAAPAAVTTRSLTVSTNAGQLEGRTTGPVDQWLGVPYARPPVGSLRWAPPRPAAPWTGVRGAMSYSSRCPQPATGFGPASEDEDCLYLNVYAPSVIPAGKKLPVLFMIHGGSLTLGAGDQHDGTLLAQSDDMIVVSVNYRLGPFGFLDLPGLSSAEPDGNFGLLDQEAALKWVHANIAAFGGDPSRVAVAGESAGGWSVCSLLTSPPARGLFSRAIMESGSCGFTQSQATARASSLAFAKAAGCPDPATAVSCLRGKDTATLLAASGSYQPAFTYGGADLPVASQRAVDSGDFARVPVLIGTNHDEARTFTTGYSSYTRAQYTRFVDQLYGSLAPRILARYPWRAYPRPYTASYALGAIWTDSGATGGGIGGCPEQNLAASLARDVPVYFFQFDDEHAPGFGGPPGYQWGAGHATELSYLWPSYTGGNSLAGEFTPGQRELSRQMVAYWGAFTRAGSPEVPGQPSWPAYSPAAGGRARLMSLRPGDQTRTITGAMFGAEHQCSFWNSVSPAASPKLSPAIPSRS